MDFMMLRQSIQSAIAISTFIFSTFIYANQPDIVGTWRSIDDKTGFSKGIVEIKKDKDGVYTGTIIEVIPRPGYTPKSTCTGCPAPYTNQPIVGLQVLTNMRSDPKNPGEYIGGQILDPVSAKLYKSHLKLNAAGTRLTVRGFIGFQVIGRNQMWLRHN